MRPAGVARSLAVTVLSLALAWPVAAARGVLSPSELGELAFDQRPGAPVPFDARLRDETGRELSLAELLGGRPSIMVLEYLRCPNLCGLVLGSLAESLGATGLDPGRDYRVLAVSIDPKEGPAEAAAARQDYADRFGAGVTDGWRFLTGREDEVRRLASAIGFRSRWDEATSQWAHPAGVVVVTASGAVSRYLLGLDFDPGALRLALTEASLGTLAAPAASLLLLCYGYDPRTGRYTVAVMSILRAAGLLTIVLGGGLLLLALRRGNRRARA